MTPLYGHTSEETAYLVNDYPYGRSRRCRIRFWLESDAKKGFRFCSQTEQPDTLRWNAPKKSTYIRVAGCMFLDEKGHVHWEGLSEFDGPQKAIEFINKFPNADLSNIKPWAIAQKLFAKRRSEGKANFKIGNEPLLPSTSDQEEAVQEVKLWDACLELLKNEKTT